jgi:hypothetical protein
MSGETEEHVSSWTVDSLHQYLQQQLNDMRRLLDERYVTQTKAVDTAFVAQATAMQTALTAAERAVATALLSAEKAVTKAEAAAEKRFESINEFRGQLSDQAATFLARSEADARFEAMAEKIESNGKLSAERIADINRRLDLNQGKSSGIGATWGVLLGGASFIGTVIAIVLVFTR